MSIISPADFKGEQLIAQISQVSVREDVQSFIDKYEPKFLKELLGVTLYAEFKAGLTEDPIEPKWVELRDETDLKEMIVCYVYYFYTRNAVTFTSGTSEVKANNDNSNVASSLDKQVRAWNEMVDMARIFDLNEETYQNWHRVFWREDHRCGCHHKRVPEIYKFVNFYGI